MCNQAWNARKNEYLLLCAFCLDSDVIGYTFFMIDWSILWRFRLHNAYVIETSMKHIFADIWESVNTPSWLPNMRQWHQWYDNDTVRGIIRDRDHTSHLRSFFAQHQGAVVAWYNTLCTAGHQMWWWLVSLSFQTMAKEFSDSLHVSTGNFYTTLLIIVAEHDNSYQWIHEDKYLSNFKPKVEKSAFKKITRLM